MSRAFQNGMTLAYWSKNELSRAPRRFESDLIKFSGKVWASRTASFRGQEIFPMMSGDAPRHTRVVSSKKNAIFFEILTLVGNFRDSSIYVALCQWILIFYVWKRQIPPYKNKDVVIEFLIPLLAITALDPRLLSVVIMIIRTMKEQSSVKTGHK